MGNSQSYTANAQQQQQKRYPPGPLSFPDIPPLQPEQCLTDEQSRLERQRAKSLLSTPVPGPMWNNWNGQGGQYMSSHDPIPTRVQDPRNVPGYVNIDWKKLQRDRDEKNHRKFQEEERVLNRCQRNGAIVHVQQGSSFFVHPHDFEAHQQSSAAQFQWMKNIPDMRSRLVDENMRFGVNTETKTSHQYHDTNNMNRNNNGVKKFHLQQQQRHPRFTCTL